MDVPPPFTVRRDRRVLKAQGSLLKRSLTLRFAKARDRLQRLCLRPDGQSRPWAGMQDTIERSSKKMGAQMSKSIRISIVPGDPFLLFEGLDPEIDRYLCVNSMAAPPPIIRGRVVLEVMRPVAVRDLSIRFVRSTFIKWGRVRTLGTRAMVEPPNVSCTDSCRVTHHLFEPLIKTDADEPDRMLLPGTYSFPYMAQAPSMLTESIMTDASRIEYFLEAVAELAPQMNRKNNRNQRPQTVTFQLPVEVVRTPCIRSEVGLPISNPIKLSRSWYDAIRIKLTIASQTIVLGSTLKMHLKVVPLRSNIFCHSIRFNVIEQLHYGGNYGGVDQRDRVFELIEISHHMMGDPSRVMVDSLVPGAKVETQGDLLTSQTRASRVAEMTNHGKTTSHSFGPCKARIAVGFVGCRAKRGRDKGRGLTHYTTSADIEVRHFLRVTLRISKPDHEQPGYLHVREVSTETPVRVLSCLADPAQWCLPVYSARPELEEGSLDIPDEMTDVSASCACGKSLAPSLSMRMCGNRVGMPPVYENPPMYAG